MIGLGVGIDYTLFIVTRFRQFLHDGLSPQDAAAAAGATAGRAVIFAGVTVAISITGLALIGLDFITKLGIGSALGVLTAVLLANSLLPAVLSLLGPRIDSGRLGHASRRRVARRAAAHPDRGVGPLRLPQREGRAPGGAASSLLLLASPVLAVRLGLADAGTAPKDQTTRQAYDLLTKGFGPGFTEPIPIVVDMQSDHTAAKRLEAALRSDPGNRAGRRADLQREDAREGVRRDHQHLRQVQAAGRSDRRPRLEAAPHGDPADARGLTRARVRVRVERGLHRHREPDLLARSRGSCSTSSGSRSSSSRWRSARPSSRSRQR